VSGLRHIVAGYLQWNLNDIGVRSFILTGAPTALKARAVPDAVASSAEISFLDGPPLAAPGGDRQRFIEAASSTRIARPEPEIRIASERGVPGRFRGRGEARKTIRMCPSYQSMRPFCVPKVAPNVMVMCTARPITSVSRKPYPSCRGYDLVFESSVDLAIWEAHVVGR
jgi:hypothetical protein